MKFLKITPLLMLFLLFSGCDQGEGMTPFLIAAHDGKKTDLEALIVDGKDLNQTSRYGWTALIFASRRGHEEIVNILLEAGCDPNIVTEAVPSGFMDTRGGYFETTALAEATKNNHLGIANRLIDHGAKIDSLSVALAGKVGDLELLARMVDVGADLNLYSNNEFHPTALCESAGSGNLDAVRWLHDHGAEINTVLGRSLPLKSGIQSKDPDVVSYLLENGADPNLVIGDSGYHHNTPLGMAINLRPRDQSESDKILRIISLLLNHGANVSHKDNGGETVLDIKLVQQENRSKHREEHDVHPDNIERVRISGNHDEKVIKLLKKVASGES